MIAAKYGWNITSMHSQGDLASQILLEAYQDAHRVSPINDMRFGIDHGLMQTPENLKMMKEMGVIPSIAAKYIFSAGADQLIYMYGPDRVFKMTPVKTLIDMGITVTAESDILAEPYVNPLWQLEKFVTRTDEKGRVWNEAERITREQALFMYTKWAAKYHWDENILGTIEPGKLADLVVLNGDYLTVPESQIAKVPVHMTLVGGKIVYREGDPVPKIRQGGGVLQ
jgi:predicted amidohydrolase YtcJ